MRESLAACLQLVICTALNYPQNLLVCSNNFSCWTPPAPRQHSCRHWRSPWRANN